MHVHPAITNIYSRRAILFLLKQISKTLTNGCDDHYPPSPHLSPESREYSPNHVVCLLLQLLPCIPIIKSNPIISASSRSSLAFSWCCGLTYPTLPSLSSTRVTTLQPPDPLQTNHPTFPYLHTQLKKTILPSLSLLPPPDPPPPLSRRKSFSDSGPPNGESVFPSSLLVPA